MFSTFDTSVSGMRSERIRLNLIANNIANVNSTRDEFGNRGAYRRRLAVFEPGDARNRDPRYGVNVTEIVDSEEAPRLVYDPGHPDAITLADYYQVDATGRSGGRRPEFAELDEAAFKAMVDQHVGYVEYPNVDPAREMADAVLASRAYEANATVLGVTKTMIAQSLRIVA